MGKIIAVALPKGGVGKTTTAVNLAYALALNNKKTLLIDVDPAGSCSASLGFTRETIMGDIFNVFNFSKSIGQVIHKTTQENLDFIPLKNLSFYDEVRLGRLANNQNLLRNILRPEVFNYDYVIIDCPPYLVGTTTNALIASDSVLIPVKSGQFSLTAVTKLMEHIKELRRTSNQYLRIEGILLTIHEYNTNVSFKAKKELFMQYPNYMFRTSIPKNTAVMEASFYNQPVIQYNPDAKASIAYMQLANEIIEIDHAYLVNRTIEAE